jgi:cytoskeletal protein CcmA (bactofilin family)
VSTILGRAFSVRGEIRTSEDLTIEGRVEGPIFVERAVVVIAAGGEVAGDIVADDITVFGHVTGQLVATDIVDVRAGATVNGHIMSTRFILDPSANFTGRVEPQHLQAAIRVARYNQKKRDAVVRA